jgi:hypothetical protein
MQPEWIMNLIELLTRLNRRNIPGDFPKVNITPPLSGHRFP